MPAPPERLLERCRVLLAERALLLAVDTRVPTVVQQDLLRLVARQGGQVVELAHATGRIDRRAVGSPLSNDRGEREAATAALLSTLAIAGASGVERVLLYPWGLPLHRGVPELMRRFLVEDDLPLEALGEERQALAATAYDRLRAALDPIVNAAAGAGVQLVVAGPSIWPHQFPDETEVALLCQEFAGAPLGACHFSDWAHARTSLLGKASPVIAPPNSEEWSLATTASGLLLPLFKGEVDDGGPADPIATTSAPAAPPPLVRLADAAGLTLRLPLDVGESRWRDAVPQALAAPGPVVFAFDEETSPAELARSIDLINVGLTDQSANNGAERP